MSTETAIHPGSSIGTNADRPLPHEAQPLQVQPLEPLDAVISARALDEVSVETDSVVATATLRSTKTLQRIVVDWGDGVIDTVNYRPGFTPLDQLHWGDQDPLPEGTYQLTHVYAAPENRSATTYFVALKATDRSGDVDLAVRRTVVTPRYRLTLYRLSVWLTGPWDGPGESTSEIDIRMTVDSDVVRQWHWEPANNFFSEGLAYRLEGSMVVREMTAADPPVPVFFHFTETDPLFDDHEQFSTYLRATQDDERLTMGINHVRGRCDREVRLVADVPYNGPVFDQIRP